MTEVIKKSRKGIGWVPLKYKTKEELEKAIKTYFVNCPDKRSIHNSLWREVKVPCPTITWLALHLWFVTRKSMYDYEWKPEFVNTIKKARSFMERIYEQLLQSNNVTGAIFALKNFGWTDKIEIKWGGNNYFNVNIINPIQDGKNKQIPNSEVEKDLLPTIPGTLDGEWVLNESV